MREGARLVRLENKLRELERRLAELEEWSRYVELRLEQLAKEVGRIEKDLCLLPRKTRGGTRR